MKNKIDPTLDPARKFGMLVNEYKYPKAQSRVIAPPPAASNRRAVSEMQLQTNTPPEITQQTQWMLAVRDSRDRDAFTNLFDFFAPRLKGVAMRSGSTSAQAEDIVQDVMLTVWRKAHLFDPARAQVSAWIYQIARNRQIDLHRAAKRPLPEDLPVLDEAQEDASAAIALEQETQKLRDALSKLKPQQREMLEQAYLHDRSHSEIKTQTGLPLGTIKSRIRLALDRLRHELKEVNL